MDHDPLDERASAVRSSRAPSDAFDAMPVLPGDVRVYKRTAEFTEHTIPLGLRRDHSTKPGVWARIVVMEGSLEYSFGEPRRRFTLDREHVGIVRPELPHQVEPLGAVRFHVEFLARREPTK